MGGVLAQKDNEGRLKPILILVAATRKWRKCLEKFSDIQRAILQNC